MFEINTATHTPDNFFAGGYPIVKEVGTVDTGKAVKKFEPVKLVGGKIQPVEFVAASAAQDYSAATAAVHTLVIVDPVSANDTITINGEVYTAVASDPVSADKEFVAGTAIQSATSLKLALDISSEAVNFTMDRNSASLTFTQKVAGIGALPTLATSVEGAATISTTTPYAAGQDPTPTKTAAENTVEGLYGIAVEAAEENEETVVYLTGEFFTQAIQLPSGVTAEVLKPALRKLGIFLKERD